MEKYKILIADDDNEVHIVTKLVLKDLIFDGVKIEFVDAYSGEEAIKIVEDDPYISVILLDIVMETEHAGLEVIKYIREKLKNKRVRIIIRTGQPGQAPEKYVISEYDINDYKEKTELTSQKLYTSVYTALRSYKDLKTIEKYNRDLERVIENSHLLFDFRSVDFFCENIEKVLRNILCTGGNELSGVILLIEDSNKKKDIVRCFGKYKDCFSINGKILDNNVMEKIEQVIKSEINHFEDNIFVGFYNSDIGKKLVVYIECDEIKNNINTIKLISPNIYSSFDTVILNQDIIDTQKELIFTLGDVVETRSKETAFHVKRVAEISRILAIRSKLSYDDIEIIKLASPMHDIGKIGIPEAILNKPGKLTPEEFEEIKKHTIIGYEILKNSNRKILKAASLIALQHHEWWDGGGYPHGLRNNEIHIFSRITAIADVFDALLHKRSYKEAWDVQKVVEFMKNYSGTQFDPFLIEILLDSIEDILKVMEIYPE